MAQSQPVGQQARFWAFVEELESKGARPADPQFHDFLGNGHQGPRPGHGRGMRGLGRGGRAARMQQAMAEIHAVAHEVPHEQASDSEEDGFIIATPVESVNEKEALLGETTEVEIDTPKKHRRGGFGGRGQFGRRGRGGPGAGLRGGFGGCGMHQGLMGRHGMPIARGGAQGQNRFGPRHGLRGGPFRMAGLRRALGEESSGDECKGCKAGKKARGTAGPGAKKGNQQKPGAAETFRPRADVFESPTTYTVNFAIPGAKKENVKLVWRSKRGVLIASGRIPRKAEDMKHSHTIAQSERAAGGFERRVPLKDPLSANINAHQIVAKLEDGVLRVDVPKKKTEKAFDGPFKVAIL